jgi:1,2-phenylacetyl-CoA epoxidase catalytic subunit
MVSSVAKSNLDLNTANWARVVIFKPFVDAVFVISMHAS